MEQHGTIKNRHITLMKKTAYNGKVSGNVTDDIRWGDKYTTKFKWGHGAKK